MENTMLYSIVMLFSVSYQINIQLKLNILANVSAEITMSFWRSLLGENLISDDVYFDN